MIESVTYKSEHTLNIIEFCAVYRIKNEFLHAWKNINGSFQCLMFCRLALLPPVSYMIFPNREFCRIVPNRHAP